MLALPSRRTDLMAMRPVTRAIPIEGGWVCDSPTGRRSFYEHRLECAEAPWLDLERAFRTWRSHQEAKGVRVAYLAWESLEDIEPPPIPPGATLGRLVCMCLDPARFPALEPSDARPIAEHEWPALVELSSEVNDYDKPEQRDYLRWFHGHRRHRVAAGTATQWVIARDGMLVAGAGSAFDDQESRLQEVMTHSEYRRRGLARAVVARVVAERLASSPTRPIWVVAERGHPAQALYRSLGFQPATHAYTVCAPAPRGAEAIAALTAAFLDASLPPTAWGHREHLTVAVALLREADLRVDETLPRMRRALVRYLAAHGIEPSPSRGYHETLTRGWLEVVARELDGRREQAQDDAVLGVTLGLADKRHLLRHWSRERMMSPEARAGWCVPDRAPLPARP